MSLLACPTMRNSPLKDYNQCQQLNTAATQGNMQMTFVINTCSENTNIIPFGRFINSKLNRLLLFLYHSSGYVHYAAK